MRPRGLCRRAMRGQPGRGLSWSACMCVRMGYVWTWNVDVAVHIGHTPQRCPGQRHERRQGDPCGVSLRGGLWTLVLGSRPVDRGCSVRADAPLPAGPQPPDHRRRLPRPLDPSHHHIVRGWPRLVCGRALGDDRAAPPLLRHLVPGSAIAWSMQYCCSDPASMPCLVRAQVPDDAVGPGARWWRAGGKRGGIGA